MEEIWKDIEGYEGLYQVSNLGNVKSLNYNHTGKERILKARKCRDGYLLVNFSKDGNHKTMKVHRLVAMVFIPNPNNLPQVNHKDENKTNNIVENLEWCDAKYNNNFGTRNERLRRKCGIALINHPSRSKKVNQYSLDGKYIGSFPSTNEVQRELGYDNSGISKCCLGKINTAYGFIWKYADN